MSAVQAAAGGPAQPRVGWIGAGRMGSAMVRRLLDSGHPVTVWNRTAARTEPLRAAGAEVADSVGDLAGCGLTLLSLPSSGDLEQAAIGQLFDGHHSSPVLVDTSTVSLAATARVRRAAAAAGVEFLSAPVSGNPVAVEAGTASFVCSGSPDAFERARPVLTAIGRQATFVGEAEQAGLLKLCHNLLLAVLTQGLSEVLVLAERLQVDRGTVLDFINGSVVGSAFSAYKTPAVRALDMTATFTTRLLLKDVDLGLAEAAAHDVPLPVAGLVRTLVQAAIAQGHGNEDFLTMLLAQAALAGVELKPLAAIGGTS